MAVKERSGIEISASWARDGVYTVTLRGVTDDISIAFKITTAEAEKLVEVLQARIRRGS
jgi:hypothetical protein